ncbi:M28 family peptidase [Methylobacter sp. YRD-M1]|uniref:M28 family peptidase n=1 Tax=Methylobacter sp. YRD-M1 TaxID=2911520 RepID=UPI00227A5CA4|nr:M28 family peptidase [Methylobacter sp. YRD-M1]WAK02932.1 M28 family peptidase [Methylobacter sp. YRD-M1]
MNNVLNMHGFVLALQMAVSPITISSAAASSTAPTAEQAGLAGRLQGHVSALAGAIGERNVFRPQALHAAADYIRAQWVAQGYQVVTQSYEALGVRSENLEITLPGTDQLDKILLIGAHYDSVQGSPGANDNASGVAALLELSLALSRMKPSCSIRFVAFVNEEPPFFYWGKMGSGVYAKAARAKNDDIRLMISLEMLGYYSDAPHSQRYPPLLGFFYPDRANFIAFVSNLDSRDQLHELVAVFRAHSDFPAESLAAFSFVPGVSWSDHLSFWRENYKAVMVTDTAFYRYAYYHSEQDTPEKLDYIAMARVVSGLQAAVASLAMRQ